ncbi:GDP-fucose protein O-fucosyltransferase 1-like [Rhipicephalus microplus]|uniref:GDP-fucose protein O-fucosyltransferase 1-like n=1 Tax=Rhipicephalus microplus TaxID=6941 RepID=UPI003F6B9E14
MGRKRAWCIHMCPHDYRCHVWNERSVTRWTKHSFILWQVVRVVRALRACSVFVATDRDAMLDRRNRVLELLQAVAVQREPSEPHVDLAILGLANHFVGNCVSSLSAFVKRHRDVNGPPSSFWAFQPLAGDGGMSASERIHQEM